jgi:DNA polymerase-3 subunit gamma/tau
MRDALSLLDQAIAYGSGRVEEAGVRAMLGAVDQSYLYDLLFHLAEKDGTALIAAAQQLLTRGIGAEAAIQELASVLHLLALFQAVPGSLASDHPQREQLLRLASLLSPETIQLFYQIALHGRRDLAMAPDEFAGLSMTLLRMLTFSPSSRPLREDHATPPVQPGIPGMATSGPAEAAPPPPSSQQVDAPAVTPPWEPMPIAGGPPDSDPADDHASLPEGEWQTLVAAMRLGGQANMLAQHAVLSRREGMMFHLAVPDAHKVVAGSDYRERLESALSQHLGAPARIQITVGAEQGATPAAQQQRERQAGLVAAEAALNEDPFVQTLIADFGATIVPDSIQPRTNTI